MPPFHKSKRFLECRQVFLSCESGLLVSLVERTEFLFPKHLPDQGQNHREPRESAFEARQKLPIAVRFSPMKLDNSERHSHL